MDNSPPDIPVDTEIKWMVIHQQYLSERYDEIKRIMTRQEIEIGILWISMLVLGVGFAIQSYRLDHL